MTVLLLQLINNGLWKREPGVFNRSFKKRSLMKFRPNSCTFFTKHLVNRGFMLGWKKTDAHGTVKNLNMKSNGRAARSGLKKVRYEATIERMRQDLRTHQKGALGKDYRTLVWVAVYSVEYSGLIWVSAPTSLWHEVQAGPVRGFHPVHKPHTSSSGAI